jgi:GNAT superfamily N-acetyltransferase
VERLSLEDVHERLQMGDAGSRANRVLHLAWRGDTLVGCCSSTFQPPWTPEGCGHWGLLVVDSAAQGTGVASAIIEAAERRLAGACARVQIEYEYTPGHAPSERLMELYEKKLGFVCDVPHPRSGRRFCDTEAQTQFRRCRKALPATLIATQKPVHLRAIKESFECQLSEEVAGQPGGVERLGKSITLTGLVEHAQFNGRSARILLFKADEDHTYVVALEAEDASDEDGVTILQLDAKFFGEPAVAVS